MRRGLLHPRLYRTHTGHGGVPGVLLIRHSPGPRIGVNDSILLGYTEGTRATHVRSGSESDLSTFTDQVCFAHESGNRETQSPSPFFATTGNRGTFGGPAIGIALVSQGGCHEASSPTF